MCLSRLTLSRIIITHHCWVLAGCGLASFFAVKVFSIGKTSFYRTKFIRMVRVLLINQSMIPHFRVPVYGYLSRYLYKYGFEFMVASAGIQSDNPHPIEFQYAEIPLSVRSLTRFIRRQRIDVIISWVDMIKMGTGYFSKDISADYSDFFLKNIIPPLPISAQGCLQDMTLQVWFSSQVKPL